MRYNFLRFPGGREKAVTLSYDDGTVDDVRFTETVNRYGLKCTFNLVGSWIEQEKGLTKEFIRTEILGKGYEVANHGFEHRAPKLFYLWGHAFEYERTHGWELLEEICEKLSGHEEVWCATNMEIYEYVNAYRSLIYSADGRTIYNPTLFEIWFDVDGTLCSIKAGETKKL